ncbi:MAG: purine-binding chemotaxis protein CheW [Ignavibacteriales bacterium]|nr:purine-binding chemotaxis protein CheW [Ignavibacteriales bacterium]
MSTTQRLVHFLLDEHHYALLLSAVERIVRSAEITPLPKAPEVIHGVLDVHGTVMPVVNIRRRFNLPDRTLQINDHFIIARTSRRRVVLPVDAVLDVLEYSEERIVNSAQVAPRLEYVKGILKLEEGLILIHDLNTFLSLDEELALDEAMK